MFNLEECMNNEFLRPRENRCKWFNILGVMREWVYIEKKGKCKFLAKNNSVNWFSKWVNRFKPLKDKAAKNEDWYVSCQDWINSKYPEWRLIRFKLLRIYSRQVRKILWYDSCKGLIDSHVSRFIKLVNRRIRSQRLLMNRFRHKWIDSNTKRWILAKFRVCEQCTRHQRLQGHNDT